MVEYGSLYNNIWAKGGGGVNEHRMLSMSMTGKLKPD